MPTTLKADAGDVEREEDEASGMSPEAAARFWQMQLELAERDHKDWWKDAERIEKLYRAEAATVSKSRKGEKRLSILYSNTQTLGAALYARTPKPDVRRRFLDRNPVARTAADILERCLIYCADNTKHDKTYKRGVQDHTLPGRGVVRYEYEPNIQSVPVVDPMTGMPAVGPDGKPAMQDKIVEQDVEEHYVYWRDVLHNPARSWTDFWWIGFRHRMTREDLRENQFTDADQVPLNWTPETDEKRQKSASDDLKRAEVWEIWDKRTKHRYWIVKGYTKALRVDEDPYSLNEFWPCQEFLNATTGNDTAIPTPDYLQYEDQADDLNKLTSRISHLTAQLKRRGIYDASIEELKRLATAGDNQFVAVPGDKYNMLAQRGGLPSAFQVEDVAPAAKVLTELYKQREQLIQSIYEVTGISDIMRGATDASETATAQNIKAQFGSMRLKDRQREVQRWVRDGYRIKAELIVEHFEPEIIAQMVGMEAQDPNFQQAVQLLKDDKARQYSVDIETDSTVFEDAEQEKQGRVELLTAMGGFAQQWLPIIQAAPEMMMLVGEMLSFGVRGFKAGRALEDAIDETMQAIKQRMSQPQPPPPDPAVEKVKAEMQRDQQSHELEMAAKQADMQMESQGQQMDMAGKQLDFQAKQADLALKQQGQQLDFQAKQAGVKLDLQAQKAKMLMDEKRAAFGRDGKPTH